MTKKVPILYHNETVEKFDSHFPNTFLIETDEENKRLEEAKRNRIRNMNIHFNFFNEEQYGICNFPASLSQIAVRSSKVKKRGFVVSCGAGRCVLEMAKVFGSVDGIDTNSDLIAAANGLKAQQSVQWKIANHGTIMDEYSCAAFKDLKCDKSVLSKCHFSKVRDLRNIPLSYNRYDCIVVMNALDTLQSPKTFVNALQRRVNKGGTLIFSECFNWKESVTSKMKWIGGTEKESSSDALKGMLLKMFKLVKEDKISFIERENAFTFRLCIANTFIFTKK